MTVYLKRSLYFILIEAIRNSAWVNLLFFTLLFFSSGTLLQFCMHKVTCMHNACKIFPWIPRMPRGTHTGISVFPQFFLLAWDPETEIFCFRFLLYTKSQVNRDMSVPVNAELNLKHMFSFLESFKILFRNYFIFYMPETFEQTWCSSTLRALESDGQITSNCNSRSGLCLFEDWIQSDLQWVQMSSSCQICLSSPIIFNTTSNMI